MLKTENSVVKSLPLSPKSETRFGIEHFDIILVHIDENGSNVIIVFSPRQTRDSFPFIPTATQIRKNIKKYKKKKLQRDLQKRNTLFPRIHKRHDQSRPSPSTSRSHSAKTWIQCNLEHIHVRIIVVLVVRQWLLRRWHGRRSHSPVLGSHWRRRACLWICWNLCSLLLCLVHHDRELWVVVVRNDVLVSWAKIKIVKLRGKVCFSCDGCDNCWNDQERMLLMQLMLFFFICALASMTSLQISNLIQNEGANGLTPLQKAFYLHRSYWLFQFLGWINLGLNQPSVVPCINVSDCSLSACGLTLLIITVMICV